MSVRPLRRRVVLNQVRRRETSRRPIDRSRIVQSHRRETIVRQRHSRTIGLPSRLVTTGRSRPLLQTSALNRGHQRKRGRPRNSSVRSPGRLLRTKSVRTNRKSRSRVAVSEMMGARSRLGAHRI